MPYYQVITHNVPHSFISDDFGYRGRTASALFFFFYISLGLQSLFSRRLGFTFIAALYSESRGRVVQSLPLFDHAEEPPFKTSPCPPKITKIVIVKQNISYYVLTCRYRYIIMIY